MTFCKLFKLLCFPPCPRNIIEHVAFQPPPPTYNVHYNDESKQYTFSIEDNLQFLQQYYTSLPLSQIELTYATTKYSTEIVCMYYAVKPQTKTTILYSHGNGSDLGSVINVCILLAKEIRCNILAYDYTGYGQSSGKPSEKRIYGDIEAAYNLLLQKYNTLPEDIILMGQSLGSAPTLDLASRRAVKGVVVQSGFASALNVAFPREELTARCCDVFENIRKVDKVTCPLLVIHGTDDDVIELSQGEALYKNCASAVEPLWVGGAGHNDVESYKQYWNRLKRFVNVELT